MTSRERVAAILNRKIPDRMGLCEHLWAETISDEGWIAQGFPEGGNWEIYFDLDMMRVRKCMDLNTEPFPDFSAILEETDEWQVIKNGRGAILKMWKTRSGAPEHLGFDVTTPEKWKRYREPLLELNVNRLGDLSASKGALIEARANHKYVFYGTFFVWETIRATLGDVAFLSSLILEPEWIRDMCQVYLDFHRRHFEVVFQRVGVPDGIMVYEDFGYNKGLFCSPRVLQDLIMSFERELVGFFKDHGIQVMLHSCGDVRQAIPLIIDAGFDCLQPMEAKAGCDVREIAATYGNAISYMGNMNIIDLSSNNDVRIEAEVVPKLQWISANQVPYIFHSDHSLPPTMNMKSYEHVLQFFRKNSTYA